MDVEALPVKEELSKTDMALDSPLSTTQADFEADPVLWGLRRSVSLRALSQAVFRWGSDS